MSDDPHDRWMAEAIAEARRAMGRTRPNPLVGCVIVRDGRVVARGHHARAGEPHAEVEALRALDAPATGCTLYVNLEPCCHHGRTPPCTEAIIAAGIERVVVGTLDPFPEVSGAGVRQLREAGIEVICGVAEDEARRVNLPYFKRITTGLPWVVAKYAMSLDGKIATRTGHSAWITGEASRRRVHRLRDQYDAILVGTGTLVADDPRLTCRIDGGRNPVRVVLDRNLRAAPDARVYSPGDDGAQTVVVVGAEAPAPRRQALVDRGVEVVETAVGPDARFELEPLLRRLSERELPSVLVEGGARLHGSLFDARLVDEVYAFVAPKLVGGREAPGPIFGHGVARLDEAVVLEEVSVEPLGDDVLIHGLVPDAQRAFPTRFQTSE